MRGEERDGDGEEEEALFHERRGRWVSGGTCEDEAGKKGKEGKIGGEEGKSGT